MQNIKLTIEYDGSRYEGWQQPGRPASFHTISGKISDVLYKMTQETLSFNCGLRTEAGVHAYRQTLNFKTESSFSPEDFKTYLNRYLPMDIVITAAESVPGDFHASLKAKDRTYLYQIVTGEVPSIFQRKYSWYTCFDLDTDAMRAGADLLLGRHDFRCFSSGRSKKSSIQTIYQINIQKTQDFVTIRIRSTNFLHNMARLIIGTLIDIGMGKRSPKDITAIFSGRLLPSAPCDPKGLILEDVSYN